MSEPNIHPPVIPNTSAEVKIGPFGRGVFATKDIKAGTLVEVAPVMLLPKGNISSDGRDVKSFDKKVIVSDLNLQIHRYCFGWTASFEILVMGLGSIYNHSFDANLKYIPHYSEVSMSFTATRDIKTGEEFLINYTYDPTEFDKLVEVEEKIRKQYRKESQWAQSLYDENEKKKK